jgi:D-3-phosphoglycerate dehydrogenase
MKILLATDKPFDQKAINGIRGIFDAAGYELVLLEKYTEKQQLLDAVTDVVALIVRSDIVDAEVIAAAKKLKIVVRAGAGYDNIDLKAATAANVCVMNTPGQNSNAVAELVFGLLIYGARNFYDGSSGIELKGKKLGIQAYGNVGRNVARIAKGLGMELYAYDTLCSDELIAADDVVPLHTISELYEKAEILSINIPATPETRRSINRDLLNLLPKGAIIVNTARKEVVNEEGMMQFMEERTDVKYLTDIKPDNHEEMCKKFPGRYFSTPKKMGAQTAEANINAGIAAANQIVRYLKTGEERFRVN